MTAQNQTSEGILSRGHNHLIRGNYVIGSNSGHQAAIAVDKGSTHNVIVGNIVEDSLKAFNIREGPEGSTPT